MLTKSIKGRICFQDYCANCGTDVGFRPKCRIGILCITCGHSKAKKGKNSPLKGTKTGKPAWNRKIQTEEQKVLRNRLSRRLRHALNNRGLSKANEHVFNLVGYTVSDLKLHLESQFKPGMNWDNMGDWHIDHVTPDSWFSYSSTGDKAFKQSWSLQNLQPMWRLENISKNNRYAGDFKCLKQ